MEGIWAGWTGPRVPLLAESLGLEGGPRRVPSASRGKSAYKPAACLEREEVRIRQTKHRFEASNSNGASDVDEWFCGMRVASERERCRRSMSSPKACKILDHVHLRIESVCQCRSIQC